MRSRLRRREGDARPVTTAGDTGYDSTRGALAAR